MDKYISTCDFGGLCLHNTYPSPCRLSILNPYSPPVTNLDAMGPS